MDFAFGAGRRNMSLTQRNDSATRQSISAASASGRYQYIYHLMNYQKYWHRSLQDCYSHSKSEYYAGRVARRGRENSGVRGQDDATSRIDWTRRHASTSWSVLTRARDSVDLAVGQTVHHSRLTTQHFSQSAGAVAFVATICLSSVAEHFLTTPQTDTRLRSNF